MAAINQIRSSVLQIINEVESKMHYTPSVTLSSRRTTNIYRTFLNDVISDVSDFGDWPQMFNEVTVTAAASVTTYEINASAPVKNIFEISFEGQRPAMWPRERAFIRQLQRTCAQGTPRQYAYVNTSGVNPQFGIDRMPGTANSAKRFTCAVFIKPTTYTTSDASVIPPFSSRLLAQGLYSKALLHENGGVPTPEFQAAQADFARMMREEWNRSGADTGSGTDVFFIPRM